ncbi:exopolyphosphatase [Weissella diestrammenae]|uniref:Exopolyphosphatase n=1 Tax=Weissella diestrammenae TaxID=1162633 RepID=A0A7G9T6M0_9LACO|nr:exopolyphosphatase [Weissella diestrammenae]MCM0582974.1 exopolyphosphatase [Weissella diestrammenae]QNN75745.1 exopolyphosphatase [Weissella diestrammenae]
MSYLAIIDLGSNSTRMVVEEIQADGRVVELIRQKSDTRLAEGMLQNNGALTQAAMTRVCQAIRTFAESYDAYPDVKIIGIATAAVREATNQNEFTERLLREFGVEVQVLSGDQEAYYDYLGAVSALDISDAWLLDTGGASVELVGIQDRMAANFISLPFGAVNLTERFELNKAGLIDTQALSAAQDYVAAQFENLPWVESDQLPIILLGGANRTLARLDRRRQKLVDEADFHGYTMPTERVVQTFNELNAMTLAQRAELLGVEANRADIIISGLLPLMQLITLTDAKKVIFSASGVREGVLQEYRLEAQEH